MRRLAALAISALALGLAACGKPDPNGPAPVVEKLYAPYVTEGGDTADALRNAPLSPALKALIDKAIAYGVLLNEPVLDFDPVIFAQDVKIANLRVTQPRFIGGDRAVARAAFDNAGERREILYDMKREGGVWTIDNIRAGQDNLRRLLAEGLAPAGAADAMIAPVKAVYETYAAPSEPGQTAEPLQSYATLSASLRPLLDAREGETRRADRDPLGFDPVIDATAWKLADVAYEAARSAVIVRFSNGGAAKTIVYDLIEENGAWAIDNIRKPDVWDLRLDLRNAGIE